MWLCNHLWTKDVTKSPSHIDEHCSFPLSQTWRAEFFTAAQVWDIKEVSNNTCWAWKTNRDFTTEVFMLMKFCHFFQAQISPFSYHYKSQDPAPANMEERVGLHAEHKVNHKPRICKMVKGPSGFGFSLNMIKNKPGMFINEVLMWKDQ